MPEKGLQRRLAAILAADVVGYSALMERAEEATYAEIWRLRREIIEPALSRHQGRLIKTTGDGFLAEFASPVSAVQCGKDIQDQLRDGPLQLRIGINLGDVIVDDQGDIYGEGINVASRLEGLAEPGGILVSEKVQREINGRIELVLEDDGAKALKNISTPVRVFAVRSKDSPSGAMSTISALRPALVLPDKPSIAVLPFQNMSGDPEQEYFADGMVEDIITALSRFKTLFVIARNSSFTYKGKAIDIKKVGRELGVRYVLEGSVRNAGGRVRITGQLIEATTGSHLWADRFDGSLENVFDLQDKVATNVAAAIVPQLILAGAELLNRKPIERWDSYDHYLRGLALVHQKTLERNKQAQSEFEAAISLDQNLAVAYTQAAFCIHNRYYTFSHEIAEDERKAAIGLASRAIELAPADDAVLGIAAYIIGNLEEDVERGLFLANRSISINPNFAPAWSIKGYLTVLVGDIAEARAALQEAVRLNPLDLSTAIATIRSHMLACVALREYEEVASWARKLGALSPTDVHGLVALYGEAIRVGDAVEASKMLDKILGLYPHLRKQHLRPMYLRYRKPEHQAAMVERINLAVDIPE